MTGIASSAKGDELPSITLITVCLNQAKYVGQTINSVLIQEYGKLQFIIFDAGSTDGSREIISANARRNMQIIFEPDNGPADALNKGLQLATGDIIGYLNADDILLSGSLETVAHEFSKHQSMDVLLGDGVEIDANGVVRSSLYSTPWNFTAFKYGQCPVIQPATFIRRKMFERIRGFNIENRTCWDSELLGDLALTGMVVRNIRVPLAGFRLHNESISGSGRLREAYAQDCERIFRKLAGRSWRRTDGLIRALYAVRRIALRPGYALRRLTAWRARP